MSAEKEFLQDEELFRKLLKGAEKLKENVGATMGPRGRNVILKNQEGENSGAPIVTKDGVTVAEFIDYPQDPFIDSAIQILKQAAIETNKVAGDGTTTSTVIAHSILDQARSYSIESVPTDYVRDAIKEVKKDVLEYLREEATPIQDREDIKNIATISSNRMESIGDLVATAVDKVGKDGYIEVEEGKKLDTELDFVEGFRLNEGLFSEEFITDEIDRKAYHEDPFILVTDHSLKKTEEVRPALERAAAEERPLIIVAKDIHDKALAALVQNFVKGAVDLAAVRAPAYGTERKEILEDLAVNVGAKFISKERGDRLQDMETMHFGSADSVVVKNMETTFVGGKGDPKEIKKRIKGLKTQLEEVDETDDTMKKSERIQSRITRLTSGVGRIRVGGATDVEKVEKKHKIEDAIEAVKSAQNEGILPGGGSMLYRASKHIEPKEYDEEGKRIGARIMKEALKAPVKQMAKNAEASSRLIFERIDETENIKEGFNFLSKEIVNMVDEGIVDPYIVVEKALESAVSSASTLLTANHAVVEREEVEMDDGN